MMGTTNVYDIISWDTELSNYKVIVAPTLFLLPEDIVEKFRQYVENGGYFITTFRSGVKNWNNIAVEEPLPGKLREILGIEVEEYDSLPPNQEKGIQIDAEGFSPVRGTGKIWCDIIQDNGAACIATYTEDYYRGKPAITVNTYGNGKAIYMGTDASDEIKERIISWALERACVSVNSHSSCPGIEIVRRTKEGREYLFILNHSDQEQSIELDKQSTELLMGKKYAKNATLVLEPKGVAILMKK